MVYSNKLLSKFLYIAASCLFLLPSCKEDKFKIEGEISGGDKQTLFLEKSDFNGRWFVVDSIKLKSRGDFKLSAPAPASPDIYRLEYDGSYIYIPVDSTETILLKSSIANYGRDFTLEGSTNAELLEKFEKDLMNLPKGVNPDSLDNFKKDVYTKYIKDSQGSIVSYYILTKSIDGQPLYNPSNPSDTKYFAAVATGFKTVRPNDPHTKLLEQTTLNSIKKRNSDAGKVLEIEADEISLIDINLADENGQHKKLSDITGKGKKVVVIFSMLNLEDAPALNIELAKIYEKYKGGVEFYNVSLDTDQYAWRDAARNLPWITVYSPEGLNSKEVREYNVVKLPEFFVYDSNGNLSSRPVDLKELESKLK